jgi:ABC-type Fe3+/spermidine/putrescine transport system ATPase subunit
VSADVLTVRVALTSASPARFDLDVAFEVPPGVTVLFGPSGAGKSRTLACIAGLERPARGRVALGGQVWFDGEGGENLPIHRRRAAYLFQSLALFPHMTAEQNVAYGITRDLPRAERRARAVAMLAAMRVAHLEGRKPATFSGGEAQRVAIARALAMRPRALLLDEPFSALDYQTRLALSEEIAAILWSEGKTVILVTHDIGEAISMANRVIVMTRRPGRIKAEHRIAFSSAATRPTPLEARKRPEYAGYFQTIWDQLDLHQVH